MLGRLRASRCDPVRSDPGVHMHARETPMAQQNTSDRSGSFSFLRPGSGLFDTFFPAIQIAFTTGQLSREQAERQAYDAFCVVVAGAGGRSNRLLASQRSFQHDVLTRFEDRKLAERYDPSLGVTPRSFIRGVAGMMLREQRSRVLPRSICQSRTDDRVSSVEDTASVREISRIVMDELMQDLPPAQQVAIFVKYSDVSMLRQSGTHKTGIESVRRCRAIARLRIRLAQRGITEF